MTDFVKTGTAPETSPLLPAPSPPVPSGPGAPKLLDRVRMSIRRLRYSPRTERAYVYWVRRFIFHNRVRHPAEMGAEEVRGFLTHLAVRERVSASTQNVALNALVFLYRRVLERELGPLGGLERAKRSERLPVVLTRDEVREVLEHLQGVPQLVCRLLYGGGLRLLECLTLRVKDIDFARNEITIRQGKGAKDRVSMLAAACRQPLLDHLERVRRQHEADLEHGLGRVALPDALVRKYPHADREWPWHHVFRPPPTTRTPGLAFAIVITCTRRWCRKP